MIPRILVILLISYFANSCRSTGVNASVAQFNLMNNKHSLNDESMRIYLYSFEANTQVALNPNDVINNGERELIIRGTDTDRCTIIWKKIISKKYFTDNDIIDDARVVIIWRGDVISFNKNGSIGSINKKIVKFNKDVIEWFNDYILPLKP